MTLTLSKEMCRHNGKGQWIEGYWCAESRLILDEQGRPIARYFYILGGKPQGFLVSPHYSGALHCPHEESALKYCPTNSRKEKAA